MSFESSYASTEPARALVDRLPGVTVLEFGAPWCGVCRGAQAVIRAALAEHSDVHHLKIEDGSGRPLGRSYGVKLWPTLVVLQDGIEIGRAVRPRRREDVTPLLKATH